MKEMKSREFQTTYQRLKEPVRVVARLPDRVKVLGYFFPGPLNPLETKKEDEEALRGRSGGS